MFELELELTMEEEGCEKQKGIFTPQPLPIPYFLLLPTPLVQIFFPHLLLPLKLKMEAIILCKENTMHSLAKISPALQAVETRISSGTIGHDEYRISF